MSGWQAGDLALCIDDSAPRRFANNKAENWGPKGEYDFVPLRRGAIYTVAVVGPRVAWGQGLSITEAPNTPWLVDRFRKVTPPAADEFDREVIGLMASTPAKQGETCE